MKLDLEIIILCGTLALAIAAPLANSIISNRYNIKMHRLHFYDQHRAEAIEGYLRAAGQLCKAYTTEAKTEYGNRYAEIFFYAPESLHQDIKNLDRMLGSREGAWGAGDQLAKIALALADQNPRLTCKRKQRHAK